MKKDSSQDAFLTLLRAGLWEQDTQLLPYEPLDFEALYNLASDQTVVGLVAAGIDHVKDVSVPRMEARPFLVGALTAEKDNALMNAFVAKLFALFNAEGIKAVLVKGQGVATCYERPLWRSSGDVDLLLDRENYTKAKVFLSRIASSANPEETDRLHLAMKIDGFDVELHGSLRTDVSARMNRGVDAVQNEMFSKGRFRTWDADGIDVILPCPDDDAIFIFTHIIGHFYIGGIGLRQICDWCRLLWRFKDSIDVPLLGSRLHSLGLKSEWKAFASLAVDYLGAPADVIPFYSAGTRWHRKASAILSYIFDTGNFGHNRDASYNKRYPALVCRLIRVWSHFKDNLRLCRVFPIDAPKFFLRYLVSKTARTF